MKNYARPLSALLAVIVFGTSLVLAYPDRGSCPSIRNHGSNPFSFFSWLFGS
jgi:hypothetical protein